MVMTALIGMGVGAALSAGISAAQGGSIGDILKSAGIGGVTGAATAGIGSAVGGSVAGMIGSGLSKAGTAMAANGGSLLTKVGTSMANVGGKMTSFGATHGIGATLSNVKSAVTTKMASSTATTASQPTSVTIGSTTLTAPGKTALGIPGQGAAKAADPGLSVTIGSTTLTAPGKATLGMPSQGAAAKAAITAGTSVTLGKTTLTAPGVSSSTTSNAGTATVAAGTGNATTSSHPILSKIGTGAKKAVGQVGVQGALSILSAGASARQASAANEIQQQSLLFQKQTYNESKAKEETRKAQLKADAWDTYSSASLFGSTLYGSDSNNTLLTNGNGNQGNYSILTAGLKISRKSDLT